MNNVSPYFLTITPVCLTCQFETRQSSKFFENSGIYKPWITADFVEYCHIERFYDLFTKLCTGLCTLSTGLCVWIMDKLGSLCVVCTQRGLSSISLSTVLIGKRYETVNKQKTFCRGKRFLWVSLFFAVEKVTFTVIVVIVRVPLGFTRVQLGQL